VTRKEEIVINSLKLFSLKGYLNTSLEDILQNSKISKGGSTTISRAKKTFFTPFWTRRERSGRKKPGRMGPGSDVHRAGTSPFEKLPRPVFAGFGEFSRGCIFITLSVELDDLRPHLAAKIDEGFKGLKARICRTIGEAKKGGEIRPGISAETITEIVFSAMIGASVRYGIDKSQADLNRTIGAIIRYLRG